MNLLNKTFDHRSHLGLHLNHQTVVKVILTVRMKMVEYSAQVIHQLLTNLIRYTMLQPLSLSLLPLSICKNKEKIQIISYRQLKI